MHTKVRANEILYCGFGSLKSSAAQLETFIFSSAVASPRLPSMTSHLVLYLALPILTEGRVALQQAGFEPSEKCLWRF